ncbi:MAG: methyltransferase domain-containing protein [Alphaproteobacteria bacterium]|nr:MAG: methyltransferase domain-containing protein [Alphaproteobacteria bacterium]
MSLAQDLETAFQLFEAGRPDAAMRRAEALLRRQATLAGAHYLLGLIALGQGRAVKARAHCRQALAHGPAAVPVLVALARAEAGAGGDPIPVYARALEAGLSDPVLLAEAAAVARAGGRLELAVAFLERAAPGAKQPELWNNLGSARLEVGLAEAALDAFNQALSLRPDYPRARANRGTALMTLGLPAEAAHDLDHAHRAEPDNRTTARNLALAHKAAHRYDAAASLLADLLTSAAPADQAMLRLDLAAVEIARGEPAAALSVLAPLPDGALTCATRAAAHEALGDTAAAISALRQALVEDPADGIGARLALARLTGEVTDRASAAFVRRLFDDYAGRFDRELVDRLDYRAPAILRDLWGDLVLPPPAHVLDLGCGTGLGAAAFADLGAVIDGVDLSGQMLLRARARGLYRHLVEGDIETALAEAPAASADLILAADVLVYLGDLGAVLTQCRRVLAPGGALLFTVEAGEGADWTLHDGNRFTHSEAYLTRLTGDAQRTILRPCTTRRDRGTDVPGLAVAVVW